MIEILKEELSKMSLKDLKEENNRAWKYHQLVDAVKTYKEKMEEK